LVDETLLEEKLDLIFPPKPEVIEPEPVQEVQPEQYNLNQYSPKHYNLKN
jgi:hypothetical protein